MRAPSAFEAWVVSTCAHALGGIRVAAFRKLWGIVNGNPFWERLSEGVSSDRGAVQRAMRNWGGKNPNRMEPQGLDYFVASLAFEG